MYIKNVDYYDKAGFLRLKSYLNNCVILLCRSCYRCIHQNKPIELFLVKKLDPTEDFPDTNIPDVCRSSRVVGVVSCCVC